MKMIQNSETNDLDIFIKFDIPLENKIIKYKNRFYYYDPVLLHTIENMSFLLLFLLITSLLTT